MRLIDADAIDCLDLDSVSYLGAQSVIDSQETVDAEPVRHGHWVEFEVPCEVVNQCGENWTSSRKKVKCSLCGKPNKHYKPPYCPNCGAKMDEEAGHEDTVSG